MKKDRANYNIPPQRFWNVSYPGLGEALIRYRNKKEWPSLQDVLETNRLDTFKPKWNRTTNREIYKNSFQKKLYWRTVYYG